MDGNNLGLWFPVVFLFGIVLYFSLPANIVFCISIILFIIFLIGVFVFFYFKKFKIIIVCLSLIMLGFFAAKIRVLNIDTHFIENNKCLYKITGIIKEIEYKNYPRLIIKYGDSYIKITVRTKIEDKISIGDKILFSACLEKPQSAVTPFGYDFKRFAYFRKISATGFATSPIKIIQHKNTIDIFTKIREKIYHKIQANVAKPYSDVISALIVGKREGIDEKILQDFRSSGTAHLLAISGLHLSFSWIYYFCFL